MKNTILALLAACIFCASCADQYMVRGTSSVEQIEGNTLYLKVFQNNDMKTIDSAQVVHGRFAFKGVMDSAVLANVYLGNVSVMPLVLEEGEVKLTIDEMQQLAEGTPLNDSLSSFIRRKTQIDAALSELPRRETRMIMDGIDHDVVLRQLGYEAQQLQQENDRLVTRFIKQNYTNVLGPGMFMILTSGQRYPVLTPQIEAIVLDAPAYFTENPYVKQYLKVATENTEKMRE